MRKLELQWMINGPGGYDNHRLTLPLPSFALIAALLIAWLVPLYLIPKLRGKP